MRRERRERPFTVVWLGDKEETRVVVHGIFGLDWIGIEIRGRGQENLNVLCVTTENWIVGELKVVEIGEIVKVQHLAGGGIKWFRSRARWYITCITS